MTAEQRQKLLKFDTKVIITGNVFFRDVEGFVRSYRAMRKGEDRGIYYTVAIPTEVGEIIEHDFHEDHIKKT